MSHYEWFRAGHIICVIAWMAGLLMLPRLLVYRIEGRENEQLVQAMDSAIARLRRIILTPMLVLTWLFGLALAHFNWEAFIGQPWFWVKILAVILITGTHGMFVSLFKKELSDNLTMSSKKLRFLNEAPFMLAIIAIIMVVVEPFAR